MVSTDPAVARAGMSFGLASLFLTRATGAGLGGGVGLGLGGATRSVSGGVAPIPEDGAGNPVLLPVAPTISAA